LKVLILHFNDKVNHLLVSTKNELKVTLC